MVNTKLTDNLAMNTYLDHEITSIAHCRKLGRDLGLDRRAQLHAERSLCRQALNQIREHSTHAMLFLFCGQVSGILGDA